MHPSHLLRLSFLAALPALCGAQSPKPPLTHAEILGRLAAGSSPSTVAHLIKIRGINFSPDANYLSLISRAGGNGILYRRISESSPANSASSSSTEDPPFHRLSKCAEFLKTGDFENAEAECRIAIDENPGSPWPILAALRASHRQQDQPPDLEELARRTVALAPNLAEAHQYLATALLSQDSSEEYSSEIQKAASLTDEARTNDPLFQLPADSGVVPGGLSDAQLQNPTETETRFQRLLSLDPDFAPTHAWVSAFYQKSQPGRSFQEMRKALELEPDNSEFHTAMAGLLAARNDTEGEIFELREAIRCEPHDPSHELYLARMLFGLGRRQESLEAFDNVIKSKPRNWEINNDVTDLLVRNHMLPAAIAEIRKFLKATADGKFDGFFPGSPESPRFERQEYLARLLFANGELDASAVEFSDLLRTHPENPEFHVYLGRIHLLENNSASGISELQRSLELEPENPETLNGLAWTYATIEDKRYRNPVEALKLAKQAVQLSEEPNAAYIDTLAEALLLNNQPTEALANEEKALQLDPTNPELQKRIQRFRDAAKNSPSH